MRISADPKDPGHALYKKRSRPGWEWKVRLSGEPVAEFITADEEQGVVVSLSEGVQISRGGVVSISLKQIVAPPVEA